MGLIYILLVSMFNKGRSPEGGNGNPLQCSCQENQRGLVGYSPGGLKESDMTEHLSTCLIIFILLFPFIL